jgi:hypothetical protein
MRIRDSNKIHWESKALNSPKDKNKKIHLLAVNYKMTN